MFKSRNCIAYLSVMIIMTSFAHSRESDFITYDWLITSAKATSYTDHIFHFRKLFNAMKVRGFLECGCGFSTKYFIDNCDKVISIEFLHPGTDRLWYDQCLQLYKDCGNWFPFAYNADHSNASFYVACANPYQDYSLVNPQYLGDLDQYFKALLLEAEKEGKNIDVAFVDPGVYIRGDMVRLLLANKVPIVVAHDTESDKGVGEDLYGWFKVKIPSDYVKIYIPWGNGTTFWINKKLTYVIDSMMQYLDHINKQRLSGGLSSELMRNLAEQ